MKNSKHLYPRYLGLNIMVLTVCFLILACENLDFTDCIIKRHAELPDRQLKRGHVGEYYYDELKASVNNDPDDDDYDYSFNVKGRLPEGIGVIQEGRIFIFEGVTLQSGSFVLQVSVSAVPIDTDDDVSVCGVKSTSKSYTLLFEN